MDIANSNAGMQIVAGICQIVKVHLVVILSNISDKSNNCAFKCSMDQVDNGICEVDYCYSASCNWDGKTNRYVLRNRSGNDCGGPPCSDGCMPTNINDGACQYQCFNSDCSWDGNDCSMRSFHYFITNFNKLENAPQVVQ